LAIRSSEDPTSIFFHIRRIFAYVRSDNFAGEPAHSSLVVAPERLLVGKDLNSSLALVERAWLVHNVLNGYFALGSVAEIVRYRRHRNDRI
jgi:hypothetical protein